MTQREQILKANLQWLEAVKAYFSADVDYMSAIASRDALVRSEIVAQRTRCLADAQDAEVKLFGLIQEWIDDGKP